MKLELIDSPTHQYILYRFPKCTSYLLGTSFFREIFKFVNQAIRNANPVN